MTKDTDPKDKVISLSRRNIESDNPAILDDEIKKILGDHIKKASEPSQSRQLKLYDDDLRALESEAYFKKRFGFAYGRRGRLAVFDLIDAYDLTNEEVRSLNRIGMLKWDGQNLTVKNNLASRFTMFSGFFYLMILLALEALIIYGLMVLTPINNFQEWVLLSVLLGLLALFTSWLYSHFLRPFNILKKRHSAQS